MGNDSFKARLPSIEKPPLVLFAPNKRPPLIHLTEQLYPGVLERQTRYPLGRKLFKWLMTVVELISKTRLESLTPEPFIAISTMRSQTPGLLVLERKSIRKLRLQVRQ